MEPRVFIGCASESLPIAEYIQRQVDIATVHVWNQEVFKAGDYTLERLLKDYTEYDFAIFIIDPVDTAEIRGEESRVARDNVLFETGLFFGHLGRERTLLVAPKSRNMHGPPHHLPSDLAGLTLITYSAYSDPRDLPAKLGPVSTTIKEIIRTKNRLIGKEADQTLKVLSGGMIYILRHLNYRILDLSQVATVLMEFNSVPSSHQDQCWRKAAQYAIQTLTALGLTYDIGTYDCHACHITDAGKTLVTDPTVQQLFHQETIRPLVPF